MGHNNPGDDKDLQPESGSPSLVRSPSNYGDASIDDLYEQVRQASAQYAHRNHMHDNAFNGCVDALARYIGDLREINSINQIQNFIRNIRHFFPGHRGNEYMKMLAGGVLKNDKIIIYINLEDTIKEWARNRAWASRLTNQFAAEVVPVLFSHLAGESKENKDDLLKMISEIAGRQGWEGHAAIAEEIVSNVVPTVQTQLRL